MTQVGCADPALTAQEGALIELLPSVTDFTIEGETLTLAADGTDVLTYTAASTTLEGSEWSATGVNNGSDALETTELTETLTAVFGTDGAFSGFGGCNNLVGTYTVSGDDGLSFEGLVGTLMSGDDAESTLEAQYIAALEKVTTYAIEGDELTLRDDSGAMQATFRRV